MQEVSNAQYKKAREVPGLFCVSYSKVIASVQNSLP